MKRFLFGADPLCLSACAIYALNRWVVGPHFHHPFLAGHLNDIFLIPAALPWVLWIQAGLRWRGGEWPTWGEITGHWAVWSLISEWVMPHFLRRCTGDWKDVVAYGVGAILAGLIWRREALQTYCSIGENAPDLNPDQPNAQVPGR